MAFANLFRLRQERADERKVTARTDQLQEEIDDEDVEDLQSTLDSMEKSSLGDSATSIHSEDYDIRDDTTSPRLQEPLEPSPKQVLEWKEPFTGMDRALDSEVRRKRSIIETEARRVKELLHNAWTDVEMWKVLQENVFDRLKALNLDSESGRSLNDGRELTPQNGEDPPHSQGPLNHQSPPELDILSGTATDHLTAAVHLFRDRFPSSPLALSVLPALQSLGPTSLTVGGSTRLFNTHLSYLAATQPTNLNGLVSVLMEMDRLVFEFDDQTLKIVSDALRISKLWFHGRIGPGGHAAFCTVAPPTERQRLIGWVDVITQRLQAKALKEAQAREQEAMESANLETIAQA